MALAKRLKRIELELFYIGCQSKQEWLWHMSTLYHNSYHLNKDVRFSSLKAISKKIPSLIFDLLVFFPHLLLGLEGFLLIDLWVSSATYPRTGNAIITRWPFFGLLHVCQMRRFPKKFWIQLLVSRFSSSVFH